MSEWDVIHEIVHTKHSVFTQTHTEGERECVCVRERESVCVRERERECVCVCERERGREKVCV